MSNFNKNDKDLINLLNSAETDVLVREEAEYLAKSFLERERHSFDISNVNDLSSKLNEIYAENKRNEQEIAKSNYLWNENKKILERIEKKISGDQFEEKPVFQNYDEISSSSSQPNYIKMIENKIDENTKTIQVAFESLDAFMQKIALNFEKIFAFKNSLDSNNVVSNNKELTVDEEVDFVKPVEWEETNVSNFGSENSSESNHATEEKVSKILGDLNNSIDFKFEETNKKVNELAETVSQVSRNLNNYVDNSESEKANLFASVSETHAKAQQDIDFIKNQYLDIEQEIEKLFSNWSINNQMLMNFENLLTDMTDKKEMYSQDLNDFLTETHQKVVEGQKSLNDLSNDFFSLREKIMDLDERIYNVEKNSEKLFSFDDRILELSKQVVLEELEKRNLLDPVQFLTSNDSVEAILSSNVFQQSLESKITRMIIDNNNYIGEEFAAKFDNVKTEFDLLSDKVNSKTENMEKSFGILESNFNDYKNATNLLAFESEIRSRIDSLDSRNDLMFAELKTKVEDANESIKYFDEKLNDLTANQENAIRNVIESSEPLSNLINEKIMEVVDLKLEKLNDEFSTLTENLEEKIISFTERYNQKLLEDELERRNSEIESKIKNETLNLVYQELTKRDEKINLHSEEIVKNYEVLIENNKILETLENLVLQQADEVDVFKHDREETIELLMSKIMNQKEQIEEIRNRIADILKAAGIDIVGNADAETDAYVIESIKQITSELVQEEIRKLNLTEKAEQPKSIIEKPKANEEDFFVSRMKDILNRLDNSPVLNISEDTSVDKSALGININDLKEENPTVKDDDFGWFYEKEYENYVSRKKDNSKNTLDENN